MYILNEEERANLLILLNRLEYKGIKEVEAVSNILAALSKKQEDKE